VQILTDTPTRTSFQWFLSNPQLLLFKKLLVSTPSLHQGLHTMSLTKVVPEGLRNRECKRTVLRKCPPVPYVPKLDPVQETVSALKGRRLKTLIGEDTTLHSLRLAQWDRGSPSHACGINFGCNQEMWTFLRLQRSPGALRGP
jgi:hypothetical protein